MAEKHSLEQFNKDHPFPDKVGVNSLFRFSKFDVNKLHYVSDLFVERKLYHSPPTNFNDPFECKPHFKWPGSPSKAAAVRNHLVTVAVNSGHTRKSAESLVSKTMRRPELVQETIRSSIQKTLSEMRICSFTESKDNLLFWSHYADSHRGFCVEYDATTLPISYAYKVKYSDEYPEAHYPGVSDARGFMPALVKSKAWEYEQEYRIIFVPEASLQPKNDGRALILSGKEIRNVYLGANMSSENKNTLIKMIEGGPFKLGIWDTSLSKTSFSLVFSKQV